MFKTIVYFIYDLITKYYYFRKDIVKLICRDRNNIDYYLHISFRSDHTIPLILVHVEERDSSTNETVYAQVHWSFL